MAKVIMRVHVYVVVEGDHNDQKELAEIFQFHRAEIESELRKKLKTYQGFSGTGKNLRDVRFGILVGIDSIKNRFLK
jgi:hypothetical protein